MKRAIIILLVFVVIGCSQGKPKQVYKKALTQTRETNLITGRTYERGWQEVEILERNGEMVKIRWLDGGDVTWVSEENIKLLD